MVGHAEFFLWSLAFDWWNTWYFFLITTQPFFFFIASILFKFILSLIGQLDRTHQITNTEVTGIDEQSFLPTYTVLVPVYKEPEVIPILIQALSRDYLMKTRYFNTLLEERFSYY